MSESVVKEVLAKYRVVAVVGLSRDPTKPSYEVAQYLKAHGFRIVPINPSAGDVLDEKAYKSLLDVPADLRKTIEIVDIFRPSGDALPIVEQAIQLKKANGKPNAVWMQLGIVNEQAAEKARKAGLAVVMDRCMMREHKRLLSTTA